MKWVKMKEEVPLMLLGVNETHECEGDRFFNKKYLPCQVRKQTGTVFYFR